MTYVSSTAITEVRYNPTTLVLTITFMRGRSYDYLGVPKHIYTGLVNASSKGQYFNTYIRDQYGIR